MTTFTPQADIPVASSLSWSGATPQLTRLALSAPSIRRKRHESVMSLVMNAAPQMSQNALASKHTNEPELPESSKGTRSAGVHCHFLSFRYVLNKEASAYKVLNREEILSMFKARKRGRRRSRIWEWIVESIIITIVVRIVRRILRIFFRGRKYT
jgi:hypothetical protein